MHPQATTAGTSSRAPALISVDQDAARPLPAHFPALDGLRGLAILLVLADMLSLHDHGNARAGNIAAYVFLHLSDIGWIGVQLFFVLSGFLISGILLDTQRAKNYYTAFYARRTLRIFPLYFSVLALAFLVWPLLGTPPAAILDDRRHQLWLWTYTSNWAGIFDAGSVAFPHFWSLAVEEQFYLVWPMLLRWRSPRQCVRLCGVAVLVSLLLRGVLGWYATSPIVIYQNSFCRMDALALGGAAAAALRVPAWQARILAARHRLLLGSLALGLGAYKLTRGFLTTTLLGQTLGYSSVALMFTGLLLAAAAADTLPAAGYARVLRWRPLRALGKYSYAMYVLHKPLHDYLGKPWVLGQNPRIAESANQNAAYVALGTALTFALAFLSWHLFEKRFLGLKRFFVATP